MSQARQPAWRDNLHALFPPAMIALSSLIILPVFLLGLPCSQDAFSHISKAAELYFNAQGGSPFLQWSPDMMRGYGHPVLAFYTPVFYWVMAVAHSLGASFSGAFRGISYLALPLAGISMYVLARRYLSRPAAFVAGLTYLFAPYLLFDAIQRGALPETLGLALLPFGLASVAAAAREPSARRVAQASVLLAVLISLHNLVPLFAVPLAVLVAGCERLDSARQAAWRARAGEILRGLVPAILAIGIAITATTYVWLPALVEVRQTLTGQTVPPASPDLSFWPRYYENLIPAEDLARWPFEPGDTSMLNEPLSRSLGVVSALLAAVALLALLRPSTAWRWPVLAGLGVAGAVSLFLASESSHWLWDHSRTLQVIQFPFRFLGPASLATALLCGLFVELAITGLRSPWLRMAAVAVSAIGVAICGWPWLFTRYCALPPADTPAAIAQPGAGSTWAYEPIGELLPQWVQALPPTNALTDQYKTGQPVNRLVWPANRVTLIDWQTRRADDRYVLDAAQPVTVTYQSFYFPGWQASLDEAPIPIGVTSPSGLMVLSLPAGRHTLHLSFQPTPLRSGALIVSGLGLLVWLVVLIAGWRAPESRALPTTHDQPFPLPREGLLLTAVPVALLGLFFTVVTRINSPIRVSRLNGEVLSAVSHPAGIVFEGEVRFLGYDAPSQVRADEDISVVQYWKAERKLGVPYLLAVRIADDAGHEWDAKPTRPFGFAYYPGTEVWPTDAYVRDAFLLHLLPGTPPGRYWVETNVFRRSDSLQLVPEPGTPVGPDPAWARVGQIDVLPAASTALPAEAAVNVLRPTPLGAGLTLAGWSLPGGQVNAGDVAHITLLWQANQQVAAVTLEAQLIGGNGQVSADIPISPGGAGFPLAQWPSLALVRDQVDWRVPNTAAGGPYEVVVHSSQGPTADLGQVLVAAPPHQFNRPAAQTPLDQRLGFARLAGYTLSATRARPGDTLTVELVWQALADTADADRVFVHLRGPNGLPITQSDSAPAEWQRPTTGWVPGEYIVDRHRLSVPANAPSQTYDLVAGLYNPATGARVGEVSLGPVTIP